MLPKEFKIYWRIFGFLQKSQIFLFFQNTFSPRTKYFLYSDFFYHQSLLISFPTHLARASGIGGIRALVVTKSLFETCKIICKNIEFCNTKSEIPDRGRLTGPPNHLQSSQMYRNLIWEAARPVGFALWWLRSDFSDRAKLSAKTQIFAMKNLILARSNFWSSNVIVLICFRHPLSWFKANMRTELTQKVRFIFDFGVL